MRQQPSGILYNAIGYEPYLIIRSSQLAEGVQGVSPGRENATEVLKTNLHGMGDLSRQAELPLQIAQDTPKERRAVAGMALDWTYRPAQRQSWRAIERE